MLNIDPNIKIYIATGHTDMRKGINQLSIVAGSLISRQLECGALFVFRGRSADRIKILWWDGQGFCLYYKCLDRGKFSWPKTAEEKSICITKGQLAMLIEGIDWRNPTWSNMPQYVG